MKHVLITLGIMTTALYTCAQTGTVADFRKISETTGNLNSTLGNQGRFGFVYESRLPSAILSGSPSEGNGAFYRIELDPTGEVAAQTKVAAADFSFFDELTNAEFGTSIIELPDRNGDDTPDYLVGVPGILPGGGVCLLISSGAGYSLSLLALPTELAGSSRLGTFLAIENNHIYLTSETGTGSIYECILTNDTSLEFVREIGSASPSLSNKLDPGDRFGSGLTLSDLNADGITDILCGAPGDDDQDTNFGAVYQLYRNTTGAVDSIQKISRLEGSFDGFMNSDDEFGTSVRTIGDLDENGAIDYAVGAPGDDDGSVDIGAVWILFMRQGGIVLNEKKISHLEGNFDGGLNYNDRFGTRIATIGDYNDDGTIDLVVGSVRDDDGGTDKGAFYTLFIERCPVPSALFEYEDNNGTVSFTSEGGEGYSHIWNFSDGGYSQQQNPVHTYESSGNYWVCLAINNGCGGNNFCTYVSVSVSGTNAVAEIDKKEIKIYPNPAGEFIRIKTNGEVQEIQIRDITGKLCLTQKLSGTAAKVNISALRTGLYLAEIWIDGVPVVKKFRKVGE